MINLKRLMAAYAAGLAYAECYDGPHHQGACFSNKAVSLFREPHRELKEFSIKGHKVMAYSRKDAIIRLKHQKEI